VAASPAEFAEKAFVKERMTFGGGGGSGGLCGGSGGRLRGL